MVKCAIFDVDDTLYDPLCGLNKEIGEIIIEVVNRDNYLKGKLADIVGKSSICGDDLKVAFPKLVTAISSEGQERLYNFLQAVYSADYARISTNPNLVTAIQRLKKRGYRVVLYTNGPSSQDHQILHVQKVLSALGFMSSEFCPSDIYDLLRSVSKGRGKPSLDGMKDALCFFGVPASSDITVFDDDINTLRAARVLGLTSVQIVSNSSTNFDEFQTIEYHQLPTFLEDNLR